VGPLFSKTSGKKMAILVHKPNRNDQNYLKQLFMAGTVVPVIDKQFPLSKAADAVRYLGEGHAKGKVIIRVEHKNDES
jgi:NADPH:quinone reductase-like Zn-dependent oxidoreductase